MCKVDYQTKPINIEAAALNLNRATVMYTEDSLPRQQQVEAFTEEALLHAVFQIPIDAFPEKRIVIKQVDYHGRQLQWNDFLAHSHFAKGRMSFDAFKEAMLNPEKIAV